MMTRGRFATMCLLFRRASANRKPLWLAISLTIGISSIHWFAPRPAMCPPKASPMLLLTVVDVARCNLIGTAHAGLGERVKDVIGGGALGEAAEKLTEAIMNGSLRELGRQLGQAWLETVRGTVRAIEGGWGSALGDAYNGGPRGSPSGASRANPGPENGPVGGPGLF